MNVDKRELRRRAIAARAAQKDKEALSDQILGHLLALPEYRKAATVLFYVDVRDEVRTRPALRTALQSDKRIVVPYCVADQLQLFHLQHWNQLSPGSIRHPRTTSRAAPGGRTPHGCRRRGPGGRARSGI